MKFDIITIFPEALKNYFSSSIIGRAVKKGLIKINLCDLRDYASNKRRTVDDKPFGGGPGMILKIEPITEAISSILRNSKFRISDSKQISKSLRYAEGFGKASKFQTRIILLSAKGKLFTQREAQRLAKYKQIVLICGHYEGIDERAAKYLADEELSIGEYVLSGGELPAAVVVDAISRLVPGVLGKHESLRDESFSNLGYLEYPQYTRPEIFRPKVRTRIKSSKDAKSKIKEWKVPKILLSGDHKKIQEWRKSHSGG